MFTFSDNQCEPSLNDVNITDYFNIKCTNLCGGKMFDFAGRYVKENRGLKNCHSDKNSGRSKSCKQ